MDNQFAHETFAVSETHVFQLVAACALTARSISRPCGSLMVPRGSLAVTHYRAKKPQASLRRDSSLPEAMTS